MSRLFAFAFLCVLSATSVAGELLFAGRVQRQSFVPTGVADCPELCPPVLDPLTGETRPLCLSYRRGCQTAEIEVVKDFIGTSTHAVETIRSGSGEFGDARFPRSDKLVLVYVTENTRQWADLHEVNGKYYIDSGSLRRLGLTGLPGLPTEANTKIAVDVIAAAVQRGEQR